MLRHRSILPAFSRRAERAGLLALLAALALAVAGVALPAVPVAAQANGQIDGNVLDGTVNGKPLAGQSVTLVQHVGAGEHAIATAVTDAQGVFHFSGLATDQADLYVATIQYQGATYSTDPISLAGSAHPPLVTLLVYDATASDAQIGVGRVVVLLRDPDVLAGTIGVSELFTVVNVGQRAYVGSPGPADGKPMNLLRFGLPDGARDLVTQDGFSGSQMFQVDRGFASTAAVPPGETQFTFAYAYPYDGTRALFTYRAIYPTGQVVIIAPPDMTVIAPRLTSAGKINSAGGQVQVWQGESYPAGSSVSIELAKLPVPGEKNLLNVPLLYGVAGLLALLAFGLVGYYLVRGPGRPDGARAAARPAATGTASLDAATTPQALVRALANLDREREAGKLDETPYRIQRDALKAELKARMLAETSPTGAGEKR